jgi:hypothetical protein
MSLETLEGLPEEVANLYKKGEDGKFHLEGSGDGLKSALQKERERANAAEKALKEREKHEADAKAAKEREELERKGEYDKLKASLEADAKAYKERAETLETKIRMDARDRAAMEAILAVKGIPRALLPHIAPNLEVVPDGDGYKVVVKDNPGQKLTDYVVSLKPELPWGFEGSGHSGGGGGTAGKASIAKSISRSDFDNLSPTARRAHIAEGGTVTD